MELILVVAFYGWFFKLREVKILISPDCVEISFSNNIFPLFLVLLTFAWLIRIFFFARFNNSIHVFRLQTGPLSSDYVLACVYRAHVVFYFQRRVLLFSESKLDSVARHAFFALICELEYPVLKLKLWRNIDHSQVLANIWSLEGPVSYSNS